MNIRFDLPSKIAFVALVWVAAITLPWYIQAAMFVLLIGSRFMLPAFHPQSLRAERAFSRFILYSIAVAVVVVLINAVFIRGGSSFEGLPGLRFHEEGMLFGLRTASRLLLLSVSVLLFFISTPLPILVQYLRQKGLSPSSTVLLLLTLHFLDQIPTRIHQILIAQQARGAAVDSGIIARTKSLLAVLSPLVLSSIVESIERGTALELRGFPGQAPKNPVERARGEVSILGPLFFAAAIVLLIFRMVQWLNG